MRCLEIKKEDKVLIIAPHPDDESIGTGGLISLFPQNCHIICMTDGSSCETKEKQDEVAAKRMKEHKKVISFAGICNNRCFDYCNGELIVHPECFDDAAITSFDKVFVPHRSETHADHKAVFTFLMRKLESISEKDRPEVYQYETRMPIDTATHFLDITDVIDNKLYMISQYESQCSAYDYVGFAKALAVFQACRNNHSGRYYEAYTKIDPERDGEADSDNQLGRTLADYRKRNTYLEMWIDLETSGRCLADYVRENYKDVAIYGYGKFGRFLYQELTTNGISVSCVMDKNAISFKDERVDIRTPDKYPDIDSVIVTNMFGIKEICDELNKIGYGLITPLWDLMIEVKG